MKNLKRLAAFFIALLLLVSVLALPAGAEGEKKNTSNRFNVCFVLDTTHSLFDTDPDQLRYEATAMFMGLLANEGNYVGSVAFSDGVDEVNIHPPVPIHNQQDKDKAQEALKSEDKTGASTFDIALKTAAELLKKNGDPNLPSVIVLISDGQDENDDNTRQEATAELKTNDIKVYSIVLNANDEAVAGPLEEISEQTGGKSVKIASVDDLSDVFMDFYNMIYGTEPIDLIDEIIPDNGEFSVDFNVPNQGVEEVNIINRPETNVENLTLTHESGKTLDNAAISEITTHTNPYMIIKMTKPEGGKWTLTGKGAANSSINIKMIYNDTITVGVETDENEVFGVGQPFVVKGYLYDAGSKISSGYQGYTAELVPVKKNELDLFVEDPSRPRVPMFAGADCFTSKELKFDKEGSYEYLMNVKGEGINKESEKVTFNVGNRPPQFDAEIKKEYEDKTVTFWLVPILTKTKEIDLTGAATDPDNDQLTYEVTFATSDKGKYHFDGEKLVFDDFGGLFKSLYTIRVSDPKGAYDEMEITVSFVHVGLLALIVFGVILLLVIAAIVILTYYLFGRRLMGNVTVTVVNDGQKFRDTQTWSRGPKKMTIFHVNGMGAVAKGRILPTGKNYIIVVLSVKMKSDHAFKAEKKFKVFSGDEITLYFDDSQRNYVKIAFESFADARY